MKENGGIFLKMSIRPESEKLHDFKREILEKTGIAYGQVYYAKRSAKVYFVGHTDSSLGKVDKKIMSTIIKEAKKAFGKDLIKVYYNKAFYPYYPSINVKVKLH